MLTNGMRVSIWGTPHIDWLQLKGEVWETSHQFYTHLSHQKNKIHMGSQAGGSVLLYRLFSSLTECMSKNPAAIKCYPEPDTGASLYSDVNTHLPFGNDHTQKWTMWAGYPRNDKTTAYRLAVWTDSVMLSMTRDKSSQFCLPQTHCEKDFGLYLIDDRGWLDPDRITGYRHELPKIQNKDAKIYLKLRANEPFETPIVQQIIDSGLSDKTTLILSVNELRSLSSRVGINPSLSWEQMFDDVSDAVEAWLRNEYFRQEIGTRDAFRWDEIIVTIGYAGAVILNLNKRISEFEQKVINTRTLVYDRMAQEGDFEREFDGQILGYNTCILAALGAVFVATNIRDVQEFTASAIKKGLWMARDLHENGYELRGGQRQALVFPFQRLTHVFGRSPMPWYGGTASTTSMQDTNYYKEYIESLKDVHEYRRFDHFHSDRIGSNGSILEVTTIKPEHSRKEKRETIFELAKSIVRNGWEKAPLRAPIFSMGKWKSADKREIEGVRNVYNAIRDYIENTNETRPLSIAVFGPPGSGKSFAVSEIAKSLGLSDKDIHTFNLSQYETPLELARAFHTIRDLNLKGMRNPLIFWDEFDSKCNGESLGWLRYFLVPMQDGAFAEAGSLHPIGRAIFVFAGGTCSSYKQFVDLTAQPDQKKPDFVSRLRAYVDVRGPNGEPDFVQDDAYVIRRAFLLRSLLSDDALSLRKPGGEIELDEAVLNALLRTAKFTHGARSLDSLIRLSALHHKAKFELSSLPPAHLLGMHVDAENFLDYTHRQCHGRLRLGIVIGNATGTSATKFEKERIENERIRIIAEKNSGAIDYIKKFVGEHRIAAQINDPSANNLQEFLDWAIQVLQADNDKKIGLTILFGLNDQSILEMSKLSNRMDKVIYDNRIRPRMVIVRSAKDKIGIFKENVAIYNEKTVVIAPRLTEKQIERGELIDYWLDRGAELIQLPSNAQLFRAGEESGAPKDGLENAKDIASFIEDHADVIWNI